MMLENIGRLLILGYFSILHSELFTVKDKYWLGERTRRGGRDVAFFSVEISSMALVIRSQDQACSVAKVCSSQSFPFILDAKYVHNVVSNSDIRWLAYYWLIPSCGHGLHCLVV
jgi:hypothetical protein